MTDYVKGTTTKYAVEDRWEDTLGRKLACPQIWVIITQGENVIEIEMDRLEELLKFSRMLQKPTF